MKFITFFRSFLFVVAFSITGAANAQIGYQVTLLDQKTGEPRTNETVSVTVTLSDNSGNTVFSQTQSVTSDAYGTLSLTVGNSSTFDNVDWSKLPFWITASVDGKNLGRTQVLSVPVAEYAKRTGTLTKQILMSKKWYCNRRHISMISFKDDCAYVYVNGYLKYKFEKYVIDGDFVVVSHGYYLEYGPDDTTANGLFLYKDGDLIPINEIS